MSIALKPFEFLSQGEQAQFESKVDARNLGKGDLLLAEGETCRTITTY